MGNLIVGEMSFQLVGVIRPLMGRIRKQDKALADQLAVPTDLSARTGKSDFTPAQRLSAARMLSWIIWVIRSSVSLSRVTTSHLRGAASPTRVMAPQALVSSLTVPAK